MSAGDGVPDPFHENQEHRESAMRFLADLDEDFDLRAWCARTSLESSRSPSWTVARALMALGAVHLVRPVWTAPSGSSILERARKMVRSGGYPPEDLPKLIASMREDPSNRPQRLVMDAGGLSASVLGHLEARPGVITRHDLRLLIDADMTTHGDDQAGNR